MKFLDPGRLKAELQHVIKPNPSSMEVISDSIATTARHLAQQSESAFRRVALELASMKSRLPKEAETAVAKCVSPRRWIFSFMRDENGLISEVVAEPAEEVLQ